MMPFLGLLSPKLRSPLFPLSVYIHTHTHTPSAVYIYVCVLYYTYIQSASRRHRALIYSPRAEESRKFRHPRGRSSSKTEREKTIKRDLKSGGAAGAVAATGARSAQINLRFLGAKGERKRERERGNRGRNTQLEMTNSARSFSPPAPCI